MPKDPRRSTAYRRMRKTYMSAHPVCEWCNRSKSGHLHHMKPLAMGGDLMDSLFWMAVCAPCHRHLTANPMLTFFGDR